MFHWLTARTTLREGSSSQQKVRQLDKRRRQNNEITATGRSRCRNGRVLELELSPRQRPKPVHIYQNVHGKMYLSYRS